MIFSFYEMPLNVCVNIATVFSLKGWHMLNALLENVVFVLLSLSVFFFILFDFFFNQKINCLLSIRLKKKEQTAAAAEFFCVFGLH